MNQLSDIELQLINSLLSEVETYNSTDEEGSLNSTQTTTQISSQENFIKAITNLDKYLKKQYSDGKNNESHMLNIFNYLQQQMHNIILGHESNVPRDVQLKCSQVFLRLPPELWRAVFSQYSSIQSKNIVNAMSVYPEWLLNELSASLHRLITEDSIANREIIFKFVKAIGGMVILLIRTKLSFTTLIPLYSLHDEFSKMFASIFTQEHESYTPIKLQCQKWFENWLDYLANQLTIALYQNDNDDMEGNYLVFVCTSIMKLLPLATALFVNKAWSALLALTCTHPTHVTLIRKKLANTSPMMNIPKLFIDHISATITTNLESCHEMIQQPTVSLSECGATVKTVRFYLPHFITLTRQYGDHLIKSSTKQLSDMLLSSFKYSLLIPALYCDKHTSNEEGYNSVRELLQTNMQQVSSGLTATLSALVAMKNKVTLSTFITDCVLVESNSVFDNVSKVYMIAIILAKAPSLDEPVQLKLFSTLFQWMNRCHAMLLRHTECENSTLSPYQKIDNYLSMFYSNTSQNVRLIANIQTILWTNSFDLSKCHIMRQLALDSLTFLFAGSAQAGREACNPWIAICTSLVDASSANLFMNSDGYIDDYDWLVWRECTMPLLERFGLIISDFHQFVDRSTDDTFIMKLAILPRSLVHKYLAIDPSLGEQACRLCLSMLLSELSKSNLADCSGVILCSTLILGHCLSYSEELHIDTTDMQKLLSHLLLQKTRAVLFKTASVRTLVELINSLPFLLNRLIQNCKDMNWLDKSLTEIFKWLLSVWNMNNAQTRTAIILFIGNLQLRLTSYSSEMLSELQRLMTCVMTVPSMNSDDTKMDWIQFQFTLVAIRNLCDSCKPFSQSVQAELPPPSLPYLNRFAKQTEMEQFSPSLLSDGSYFQDHMPSRKEEVCGQKRKREATDFVQRQTKRRTMAKTSSNTNANLKKLMNESQKALQSVLKQINTVSDDISKKSVLSQAQQLSRLAQEIVHHIQNAS